MYRQGFLTPIREEEDVTGTAYFKTFGLRRTNEMVGNFLKMNMASPARSRAVLWVSILILLTTLRAMVVTFIPSLEMLGGINSDAWFAPWISDAVLGVMAPFVAYFAFRSMGTKLWGFLVAYNAVGAFDYAHGLATQWTHPLLPEFNSAAMTYGSISISMCVQITVLLLLFRKDVVGHFNP